MQVTITARHFELTDALRKYVEEGIRTLKKYSENIIFAEVVLWKEKNRHFAEFNIKVQKLNVFSKSKQDDMYKAIDDGLEKTDKQIKKHFEKIQEHHPNNNRRLRKVKTNFAPLTNNVNKKEVVLSNMDVENAINELNNLDESFVLFRSKVDNKINLLQKINNDYELLEIR